MQLKRKWINVINTDGPEIPPRRIRCESCRGVRVHVYKLDPTLYICPDCAETWPISQARRENEVGPVDEGDNGKTFIASVNPRPDRSGRLVGSGLSPIKKKLEEKGYQVTDFYENYLI